MFNIFKKKKSDLLVTTSTGELCLPVRIYYKIHNTRLLKKALRKLKCIQFTEEDDNCFTIFYCKEAKKLNLASHYQSVPKEFYPTPVADCNIKTGSTLHIDTNSLRRAVELIDFLVKNISSNLMEVIAFANMNKAFTVKEGEEFKGFSPQDYNNVFDNVACDEDRGLYDKINALDLSSDHTTEQAVNLKSQVLELFVSIVEQEEGENYPDAEKISIKYNRADHHQLMNMLVLRATIKENVAHAHFEGNKNYTSLDAMQEIMDRIDLDESQGLSTNL
jgi:hypothetical protein